MLPFSQKEQSKQNFKTDSALESVVFAIGEGGLQRLMETMGGLNVNLPNRVETLTPDHGLVIALGYAAAVKLVDYFAGETFYVPNGKKATTALAEKFIFGVGEGKSNAEIAREFGVTDRWVRQVLWRYGIRNPNRHSLKTVTTASVDGLPRVSNGGLTGLGRISGTIPAPANENRPQAR